MYTLTKKELVDAISIPIMHISSGVILYHKVKLANSDKDNKRNYYHKEYSYLSKYTDQRKVSTVNLSHSSILTITNKNEDSFRENLIINITNRDHIVKNLKKVRKLFKRDDIFVEMPDGTIAVNPKLRKELLVKFTPYRDKVILIRPCIIVDTYEDDIIPGIEMCLDIKTKGFIQIKLDTFKTFIKFIKKFDFHIAGLTALNYLQCAEIGKYEVDFTKVNINDFDIDLEPVSKLSNTKKNDSMEGLKTKEEPKLLKNKGW